MRSHDSRVNSIDSFSPAAHPPGGQQVYYTDSAHRGRGQTGHALTSPVVFFSWVVCCSRDVRELTAEGGLGKENKQTLRLLTPGTPAAVSLR